MSYSIGQVSQIMNISAHTLRYYDKEGLMPFVKRTPSGKRIFEDSDIEFLAVIYCLKQTGMTIEKIREFIEWAEEGDSTLGQRYALFKERRHEVDKQIETLLAYRDCIDFKCDYYKTALKQGTENIDESKLAENFPLNKIIKINQKKEETHI